MTEMAIKKGCLSGQSTKEVFEMNGIPRTYRRILLLTTLFVGILVSSITIELLIDRIGFGYIKQSIGIIGLFLILLSFLYSARKKGYFKFGNMKRWLKFHEVMTIGGTILILIHTGWHFSAILPQITLLMMVVTVISGLIGAYLYQTARSDLREKEELLRQTGRYSNEEIENELALLASTSKFMARWRKLHIPIVEFLFGLIIIHVISAVYYTGRIW